MYFKFKNSNVYKYMNIFSPLGKMGRCAIWRRYMNIYHGDLSPLSIQYLMSLRKRPPHLKRRLGFTKNTFTASWSLQSRLFSWLATCQGAAPTTWDIHIAEYYEGCELVPFFNINRGKCYFYIQGKTVCQSRIIVTILNWLFMILYKVNTRKPIGLRFCDILYISFMHNHVIK